MILNGSDLITKNKNRVFKRLKDRKTPINVYTTLLIPNTTPEKSPEQAIARDDSLYCLPQDIQRDVDIQLRTGSVSSTSTSSSTGGANLPHCAPPTISPRPPIPRLHSYPTQTSGTTRATPSPSPPRSASQSSNGKMRNSFLNNLTKHAYRGHRYSTSSTTMSTTNQEVAQPGEQNESGGSQDYADMDPLFQSDGASSLEEDSLLYEDLEANRNRSNQDIVRTVEEIHVKTLALIWWSEKLNKLTDRDAEHNR